MILHQYKLGRLFACVPSTPPSQANSTLAWLLGLSCRCQESLTPPTPSSWPNPVIRRYPDEEEQIKKAETRRILPALSIPIRATGRFFFSVAKKKKKNRQACSHGRRRLASVALRAQGTNPAFLETESVSVVSGAETADMAEEVPKKMNWCACATQSPILPKRGEVRPNQETERAACRR